jgi:nucleoside-triphosphatase THEP1
LIIPPNSGPVFSRLMRADKYAVSKNRVTRIASNAASRAFNAASASVG